MNPNPDSIACPAEKSYGRPFSKEEVDQLQRLAYALGRADAAKASLWSMIHSLADVQDARIVALHEAVIGEWVSHIDDNILASLKAEIDAVEQGDWS